MSDEPKGIAVEEPVAPEPEATNTPEAPEVDVDGIMQELSQIGVTTKEKVVGMATASKEAGRLAQMLGEERAARRHAEEETRRLREQRKPEPEYGEYEQQNITKDDIKSAVVDVVNQLFIQPQRKLRQVSAAIQDDEDYKVVEGMFSQHIQNPMIQEAVAQGHTSFEGEYSKIKAEFYKQLAIKGKSALEHLQKTGTKPKTNIPHVESSSGNPVASNSPDDDVRAKLKSMVKPENFSGTNSDIEALVRTKLGDNWW